MSESKFTWQTPFFDAYRARWPKATWRGGQIAKSLAPLIDEWGVEETLQQWTAYLALTEPLYFSPARFAQGFGEWGTPKITITLGPLIVQGWLSEEADKATRP